VEPRKLPKIDRVVASPELERARVALGARTLTAIARDVVSRWRQRVRGGESAPSEQTVVAEVAQAAADRQRAGLTRVINATGVVLPNLGRAPLPAVERIAIAGHYSNLELDVKLGTRARRGAAVEASIAELTGAGDALVVNNNAAAVLLALSSLAAGADVLVSRGELVEIGGGFRISRRAGSLRGAPDRSRHHQPHRIGDFEKAMSEPALPFASAPVEFSHHGLHGEGISRRARGAHQTPRRASHQGSRRRLDGGSSCGRARRAGERAHRSVVPGARRGLGLLQPR
jgi:L-seryl-tRNA(Ser) seleniumtransferase